MSNFRERMRVKHSGAEYQLQQALWREGIRTEMDVTIPLTVPDLYIPPSERLPKGLSVFLDGPPHTRSLNIQRKDELINQILNNRNIPYIRFTHKGGRISKRQLNDWINQIKEVLKLD